MTAAQGWLLVGIPALVVGVALYTSRSPRLGLVGLLVLLAAAGVLAPVDRVSSLVVGAVATLLYATGRAGRGAAVGEDPVERPTGVDTAD